MTDYNFTRNNRLYRLFYLVTMSTEWMPDSAGEYLKGMTSRPDVPLLRAKRVRHIFTKGACLASATRCDGLYMVYMWKTCVKCLWYAERSGLDAAAR